MSEKTKYFAMQPNQEIQEIGRNNFHDLMGDLIRNNGKAVIFSTIQGNVLLNPSAVHIVTEDNIYNNPVLKEQ
jgi:hypothetical protein